MSHIKEKISPIVRDDIPESLKFIISSHTKMESLISGMLKLSRSGSSVLTIEEIDMNNMVADIISNYEYKLNELGIKFEITALPACRADKDHLNQVFSNLIDNATKYLKPANSGVIKVSGCRERNNVFYCIEDNGVGISPAYQNKIFEIFHRLEPDQVEGEGLGLTIAQKIIERHNGKIRVESELGKGSKFFVSLPL